MARLVLSEAEAALCDAVGTDAFLRARDHVKRGELADVHWEAATGRARALVWRKGLNGEGSGVVNATVTVDESGVVTAVTGTCSCGLYASCAHTAAVVLAALSERKGTRLRPPAWEATLARLIEGTGSAAVSADAEVGLQFDLVQTPARQEATTRIALRPVTRGQTSWVRTGVSWSSLSYLGYRRSSHMQQHLRLLNEILQLSSTGRDRYIYQPASQMIFLDTFPSRRIWDLLAEAEEMGLPLVQAGRRGGPVVLGRRPARMTVRADRIGDDLLLAPILHADGVAVAPEYSLLVGEPAHGVVWWGVRGSPEPAPRDRVLRLAPLAGPLSPDMAKALTGPAIRIPAADEARFFGEFYPRLARQLEVVAAESVTLPATGPTTLTLTLEPLPTHTLSLRWEWTMLIGDDRHTEPLWQSVPTAEDGSRDSLIRRVSDVVTKPTPGLLEPSPTGPRLAATATLTADAMIRFLGEVLPQLTDIDGLEVVALTNESTLEYREANEAPVFAFESGDVAAQQDWFDLAVRVSIDGEQVPFDELFMALAQDREYLILASGAYISLDRAEFRQLGELIAEARALDDPPPGVLRVGRFQAGLWQELAEFGQINGQAAAWQQTIRSLTEAGVTAERPLPRGLRATLRPYQREGYGWLAALHDHRLGGILADDMGLGKTIQALALICHARERDRPFLVVAPASVVHNWVAEAARFAPDLTVRSVTQTRARRGIELAEVVRGADVVVTSYTLFRIEYDDYQRSDWTGLVLDEAQFVKNAQSQAYRCARRLPTPFKLAITGTPMENNLAELWSLLSITAPGLFPRLDRFTEYYRNPIEKGRDTERLGQLRRRIAPLVLRRSKANVAAELPDKQEQILDLELDHRHRKVYQTYLQRERQKVLGLLGNLEKNRFEIFRSLTLLRQASLDVSLVDPKHTNVPSTKLDVLAEQVANLVAEGHRTLVFSQFTRFLTAARHRLESTGIDCCYLDGKTRNRAAVLTEFKEGSAPVFMISLKAGGFGLNLTEADYCILLDPWWNPATEAQAVDRVHRIGQPRNVMVYRLVAKDTIEEKVMALKARKAELFSSVLDGGDFSSVRLSAADIRALLE